MIYTALPIITDALLEIGAIASLTASDEVPTTPEQQDGLNALNKLLDNLNALGITI